MACNNECGHQQGGCGTGSMNSGLIILVLYILLAILIGSHFNNNYYY